MPNRKKKKALSPLNKHQSHNTFCKWFFVLFFEFNNYATYKVHCTRIYQEKQALRWLTFQCKTGENVSVMSLIHTSVKQMILRLMSLMYVATVHCLNYSGQESKQEEQTLKRFTLKCKIQNNLLVMSLKYTTVTQSILCLVFLMSVATMHH